MSRRHGIGILLLLSLYLYGCGSWFYTGQQQSVMYRSDEAHLPEADRRRIGSVNVVLDTARPQLNIGGDYGQHLPTVGEGAGAGMVAGVQTTGLMAGDPHTLVLIPFILPVAMVAGGIAGAAAAKIENELAEFREGLADDIVSDNSKVLPGPGLAEHLQTAITAHPDLLETDTGIGATLTVSIPEISIHTIDKDAIVTTFATVDLLNAADRKLLYTRTYEYAERDRLRNWTADDNTEWDAYRRRAESRLTTEIRSDLFEIVHLRHVLRPVPTTSYSGTWSGNSESSTPTLAWELFLLGGDPYETDVDVDDIRFDIRIYDRNTLLYAASGIAAFEHTVRDSLPGCRSLRWSVRPVYRFDGKRRAGDWMQFVTGFEKVRSSTTPAAGKATPTFWRHFAELKTRCSS